MLPWLLCGAMAIVVLVLVIKILWMQKSMDEICRDLTEHLSTDTNRLISVSSRDPHVRRLASEIAARLAELRKLRRQYLNGDRELKDAVANISHDLRTPLTAICGYLELLEGEDCSDTVRGYLERITDRAESMKALTEELFRYSVITSVTELNYQTVNLGQVLEESLLSFYAALVQKGITPEISLPEDPVLLWLDPSALSRIFGNILSNAVKYSDGDLSVVMDGEKIVFSNTAHALSSVDVGKLFDRFFTVDTAGRSTGLGLSIARLLVERMGGTTQADYTDGKLFVTLSFPKEGEGQVKAGRG